MDIDKLIEKKLVQRERQLYYVMRDGSKELLGNSKAKALDALSKLDLTALQTFEAQEDPRTETLQPQKASESKSRQSSNGPDHPKTENPQPDEFEGFFEKALGSIDDLRPEDIDQEAMSIFLYCPGYGYIDSRIVEHPGIKANPIRPRWFVKTDKVDNGKGFKVDGYTVALKANFERTVNGKVIRLIKTNRDDSQKEPFWTLANHILCVCKRKDHEVIQLTRRTRTMIKNQKSTDSRKEFGSKVLPAFKSPEAALKTLEGVSRSEINNARAELIKRPKEEFQEGNRSLDELAKLNEVDPEAAHQEMVKRSTIDDF